MYVMYEGMHEGMYECFQKYFKLFALIKVILEWTTGRSVLCILGYSKARNMCYPSCILPISMLGSSSTQPSTSLVLSLFSIIPHSTPILPLEASSLRSISAWYWYNFSFSWPSKVIHQNQQLTLILSSYNSMQWSDNWYSWMVKIRFIWF